MKSCSLPRHAGRFASLLGVILALASAPILHAQDQTATFSPIVVNGSLPFDISLSIHSMGAADVPTLQAYAVGHVGDDYVFLSGRTNGMHFFSGNGTTNFPPQFQNTNVTVINPVTQQVWTRSLSDVSSGLNQAQIDSLSATAPEFYQSGSTLYVAGGYVYDHTLDNFTTYNTLTALNLSGVASWVKTGTGSLASNMLQTTSPTVQVTGGAMTEINGLTIMSVGQDFEGGYVPASNGNYTQQIRTFNIVNNGTALSITNITATTPDPNLRRRDLNVGQILTPAGNGTLVPGQVVLSGVFTPGANGGIWTVPVEVTANGTPSMKDPSDPTAFKQGMNNYHSPVISLFDTTGNVSHNVVFGGLSVNSYDAANGTFVFDDGVGWIRQSTDIARDASGNYTQYLMNNATFPFVPGGDNGTSLLFGTEAEFMPVDGLPMLGNGMIDIRSLSGNTLLGYIYGGIQSPAGEPNSSSDTTASNYIFDVYYNPSAIPEPALVAWFIGVACAGLALVRRRKAVSPR